MSEHRCSEDCKSRTVSKILMKSNFKKNIHYINQTQFCNTVLPLFFNISPFREILCSKLYDVFGFLYKIYLHVMLYDQ